MNAKKPIMPVMANYLMYMLVLSYVLPSGILRGIPIQRICIYALLLVSLVIALKEKPLLELIRQFKLEILVTGAGVLWWGTSYLRGEAYCTQFFSLLYVTLFLFTAVVILIRCDVLDLDMLVRCMLVMLFGKMLEKMGMELLFLLDRIPYEQVGELYRNLFGTDVTTMTMDVGTIEFIRVQSSSDAIVFSLSPALWFLPQIKKEVRTLLFVLTGAFSLIVFSRIYLAQFAFFAVVLLVYYGRKASKKIKIGAAAVLMLTAVFWLRPAIELISLRFFSSYVSESDSIRMEQLQKFMEEIPKHLWLGKGMGSYLPDYLRSIETPFSYELEYVSYIYQLGIVGFVLIIGGMVFVYVKHIYEYCKYNEMIVRFVSLMIMVWYLLRPVFNPAFLGKQNGFIVLGIFMINAYCYKNKIIVSRMLRKY